MKLSIIDLKYQRLLLMLFQNKNVRKTIVLWILFIILIIHYLNVMFRMMLLICVDMFKMFI
ncbi:hypothetical protein BB778_21760 [Pluralibacter gergoviae]|nr:hypothetical protein BB778_21760 [Pluralibacter gergoviae]